MRNLDKCAKNTHIQNLEVLKIFMCKFLYGYLREEITVSPLKP